MPLHAAQSLARHTEPDSEIKAEKEAKAKVFSFHFARTLPA
jgi:hypothetical protein